MGMEEERKSTSLQAKQRESQLEKEKQEMKKNMTKKIQMLHEAKETMTRKLKQGWKRIAHEREQLVEERAELEKKRMTEEQMEIKLEHRTNHTQTHTDSGDQPDELKNSLLESKRQLEKTRQEF